MKHANKKVTKWKQNEICQFKIIEYYHFINNMS